MKLVIDSAEGEHAFDELLGAIEGLEVVRAESNAEAVAACVDADVYYGRPSDELVAAAPDLKLIQTPSAGVDFLMFMPGLAASSIPLANTRGAHAPSIAEHAFAQLLALTRGLNVCSGWQRDCHWGRGLDVYRMPKEIMGSTIGIFGYGAIGREIAKRALGFGMNVIAVDAYPTAGAPHVAEVWGTDRLHEMLSASDVLAVAAPYTRETRHCLGAEQFAAMKPGGYVIAVSRGGIIDEAALAAALESGHLAGAGLDVFEHEPLANESPFWGMPNVIVTPHLAGSSRQKEERCVRILQTNLIRLQRGEPLVNLVDKHLGF